MRGSDFESIDNYQSNQGMGSGDGIDSLEGGNNNDPVIGFGNDSYQQFSDDMLETYLTPGVGSVNPYSSLNALNNFSGGAGDFGIDGSRMGLNTALADLYTKERGASNINPFPEGPFGTDTIFGKVDRTKDLGQQRVNEINELRARQAFGLPSLKTGKDYTGRDYYDGQETIYGTAQPLPMGGLESFVTSLPGISTVKSLFGGGQNLPPNHPESIRLRAQAEAEAKEPGIIDQVGSTISQFNDDVYNSLSETGDAIGDFITNMTTRSNRYMDQKQKFSGSDLNSGVFSAEDISKNQLVPDDYQNTNNYVDNDPIVDLPNNTKYPTPINPEFTGTDNTARTNIDQAFTNYSPAGVGIEQLGSMNPDGEFGNAAGSLFKRTTENSPNYIDGYTSPNFTQAEIQKKYNEDFGVRTPTRVETSIPKTNSPIYPKGTRSSDLDAAAAAFLELNRDSKMDMDFPTFYSNFRK